MTLFGRADHDLIRAADLMTSPTPTADEPGRRTMADLERDAIRSALAEVSGNRRMAAERLQIGVRTLYEKLKRYGLE